MHRLRIALIPVLLVSSCGDDSRPMGPEQDGARILEIGDVVQGILGVGPDEDTLALLVEEPQWLALALDVEGPGVVASVFDADSTFVGGVQAGLGVEFIVTLAMPAPGTYRVVLHKPRNVDPTPPQPYRLEVLPVDSVGETASSLTPGQTITETLDSGGDIDIIPLVDVAGRTLNAYYRVFDRSMDVTAWIRDRRTGEEVHRLEPLGQDDGVRGSPIGRFVLPSGRDYDLMLTPGFHPSFRFVRRGGEASFRVELYEIDPSPETLPAAILPGRWVSGEAIAPPGDIDVFSFTPSDTLRYLLFTPITTQPNQNVQIAVVDGGDTLQSVVTSHEETRTEYFALPARPMQLVAIGDKLQTMASQPYDILLSEVDPDPENAPRSFAIGSDVAESLVEGGDLDEYSLDLPGSPFTIVLIRDGPTDTGITLRSPVIFDRGERRMFPGEHDVVFGSEVDTAGTADLSVIAWPGDYAGAYRLLTHAYSRAPEDVPVLVPIGATLVESVERLGDADEYEAETTVARQYLDLTITALGESGGPPITVAGSFVGSGPINLQVPTNGSATQRLLPVVPQAMEFQVRASRMGPSWEDTASYILSITEAPTDPELASPDLIQPDTLNETIQSAGDIDRFRLDLPLGELFVAGVSAADSLRADLTVFSPTTGEAVASSAATDELRATDVLTMPEGGLTLEVVGACAGACQPPATGDYTLFVFPFDPAPESNPPQIAFGDTIVEAIDFPKDVDEFTVDGTAGDTIDVFLGRAAGTPSVFVRLTDPNGVPLIDAGFAGPSDGNLHLFQSRTLPLTGEYRIRVDFRGVVESDRTGEYRLSVRR